MAQFKNFVPIVNFDLLSEFVPYINFLVSLSEPFAIKDQNARLLFEIERTISETSFLPDQVIDLGYENTNTFLNLGSLFLTLIIYGFQLIWLIVLWGFSKTRKFKNAFNNMHYYLFFNGLYSIFFNTYFAFIYSAMILVNTKHSDENYHFKQIMFSWALMVICAVIMPAIVVYSALVPLKKRKSKEF